MGITKFKKLLFEQGVRIIDLQKITIEVDELRYGVSTPHLYNISNGKINPNVITVVIICKALSKMLNREITPNDIIDY